MTRTDALAFFITASLLLAFGLWTAERQFARQDLINQEALAWAR